MVRVLLAALMVGLVFAGPARAAPDWRRAGGNLFADTALPNPPMPTVTETDGLQLPTPRQPYADAIRVAATRHGLDPKLLHALVIVESRYQPRALSPAGAAGLTQLMPRTALSLGVTDRFDAIANLTGGAEFLVRQLLRFGDLRLALAAYNAGPERVARLGRIPDLPETRAYVDAVVECYLALSAGRAVRSAGDCAGTKP